VTTAFTASGDVSDFTPSKKEDIKTVFATAAGVDPSVVTVTVTSASVLITVAIALSSPAAATTAVSTLSTGILANQGSLAAALQAAVPSIVVQAIVTAPVITSGPGMVNAPLTLPPADNTNTIIIAVVVSCSVVICFVIGLAFYHRRKQGPHKKGAAQEGSSGAEMQSIQLKEKYKPIPMGQISYGDQLGTGAFGVVYKCTFQATKCAIKKLHAKDAKSEFLAKALMDEFHVMATLRHPNVLLTLGIAEDAAEGTKGIVMELMEASLADVLQLEVFQQYASWDGSLLSIASDVANGMAYIHFNNMLHRDLKPGNVLLDAQWVAKVADFGTSFDAAEKGAGSSGGDIQGTPPYMAPEIVKMGVYDKPVDVWAYGCMLAHMGTKRPPYSWLTHIETPKQLIEVVRVGEYSPLELLLESTTTPDAIKELAKKCCEPGSITRPTFEQISGLITAAIPEGVDPRPVARIKNKRPLKTGLPESPGADGSESTKFREKFKSKALEVPDEEKKATLFETFSDTLLTTFTPKGSRVGKDSEEKV
jgi:serine/threonine protein kinase